MGSFFQKLFGGKRGFYQGGKKTKANRDFWNANSSFEDTATPDRDVLRARARWLKANNPIMASIDGAIVDNVVGQGITMQSRIGKAKLDDLIELRFSQWANNPLACDTAGLMNFYDMQKVLLSTRMVDGEVYIHLVWTKTGLQLQLIEADALDAGEDNGVEKGSDGRVTGYRFKIIGEDGRYGSETVVIPSHLIINYSKIERFTQTRGVSEYSQAILDIKNFSAYQSSTIMGARARSSVAYTIRADVSPTNNGVNTDDNIQEINGVLVYYLKQGESIDKQAPSGASDDYKSFVETTIRMIATARRVSYELAFKDYSKVNFASSRASLIQDNYRFDGEQNHMVNYVLQRVYANWLENEIMLGLIPIKLATFIKDPTQFLKAKWITPKRAWVDPLKDLLSIEKEIALNLTTQTDQAQRLGLDFEEVIKRKAREVEILKENDLYIDPIAVNSDIQSPHEEIAEVREMLEELISRER